MVYPPECRATLPKAIAALTAEGQALVRKVQETTGPATHLLGRRLQEVGAELARREQRLAEVERRLTALDDRVAEAEWVASVLRDFDALWDIMTPANRYRLVHAVVTRVVVNEATEKIEITLAEFDEDQDASESASVAGAERPTSHPSAPMTEATEARP